MKTFNNGGNLTICIPRVVVRQLGIESGEELMWYVHNDNELRISKIPEDYEPQIFTDAELAQEFEAIQAQEESELQNQKIE